MEISPRELRTAEIPDSFRGYNRDVVDEFLERAAASIEALQERNRQLTERLQAALATAEHAAQSAPVIPPAPEVSAPEVSAAEVAPPVVAAPEVAPAEVAPPPPIAMPEPVLAAFAEPQTAVGVPSMEVAPVSAASEYPDDLITRTLLMAQKAADETIAEADKYSLRTREEANTVAARTIADANAEAERVEVESQAALQQALSNLEARRSALEEGLDLLERFDAEYRARLRATIASDLELLERRPLAVPGARPTVEPLTIEAGDAASSPTALDVAGHADPESPADNVEASMIPEVEMSSESAGSAEPLESPEPTGPMGSTGSTGSTGSLEFAGSLESSASTGSEDSDQVDGMLELIETNVLDDDAFFASLREAVHDDSPLGPTDNDDGLFPRA
ncbi:MAG: DivIVA domain-containing protein [Acidimicrobiia bacterium]